MRMHGTGFEPARPKPADLKTAPLTPRAPVLTIIYTVMSLIHFLLFLSTRIEF
jgi:hypothetical protein